MTGILPPNDASASESRFTVPTSVTSGFPIVTNAEVAAATARHRDRDPAAVKLIEHTSRIANNESAHHPLERSTSGNLFLAQALLFDCSLAFALTRDERFVVPVRSTLNAIGADQDRHARLPSEVHRAFALVGMAVAASLCGDAIDADHVTDTAAVMTGELHRASLREDWGDRTQKRNAWNHTAVAFSAIGAGGLLCRERYRDADDWVAAGVDRMGTFFADGVTEQGMTREGLAYCGFSFRNAAPFLLACRNAGGYDYRAKSDNPHVERLARIPTWYALQVFPSGRWLENYNDSYWHPGQALWGFLPTFGALDPPTTGWVHHMLVGEGGDASYGADHTGRSSLFESVLWSPSEAQEPQAHLLADDQVGFITERVRDDQPSGFSFNCGQYIGGIHDQADNGSFTFFAGGVPLVIDSGAANQPVEGSPGSSVGHNLLLVDGRGQMPCGGGFGVSAQILDARRDDDVTVITADLIDSYNVRGYNPLGHAVRHVAYIKRPFPYLLVIDDTALPDAREATFEQLFHTPSPSASEIGDGTVVLLIEFEGASRSVRIDALGPDAEAELGEFTSHEPQPPLDRHALVRLRRRTADGLLAAMVLPSDPNGKPPQVSAELDRSSGVITVWWSDGAHTGVDRLTFTPGTRQPAAFERDGEPRGAHELLGDDPVGSAAPMASVDTNPFEELLLGRERRLQRLLEATERLTADDDYPVPPERGVIMGDMAYKLIGREFLTHFVAFGDLHPDSDVLDVGCGGGRMAAALLYYLRYGSYVGFDIHEPSIAWCREHIGSRNPRFRFEVADLRNSSYNPAGEVDPVTYQMPYEDGSFQFVIATSLFTHMFREETANYLREFHHVLRPQGAAFVTGYFLNSDSMVAMVREPRSVKFLSHEHDDALIQFPDRPSAAVAMPLDWFMSDARAAGLRVERIAHGAWTAQSGMSKQDVLLLRRER